jgi:hypothetical protein
MLKAVPHQQCRRFEIGFCYTISVKRFIVTFFIELFQNRAHIEPEGVFVIGRSLVPGHRVWAHRPDQKPSWAIRVPRQLISQWSAPEGRSLSFSLILNLKVINRDSFRWLYFL